jgi:uracil-DNA glycosylase family 4
VSSGDGLALDGVWVAAVNRCAPPGNKPTPEERDRCVPFLVRELALLPARVVLALGSFAWDGALRAITDAERVANPRPKPRFGHGAEASVGSFTIIGAFHPSQQNTFTGKLTPEMFDEVVRRARFLAG